MRRFITTVAAVFLSSCALGYESHQQPNGLKATDLGCARRLYIGEGPHTGMPHIPADQEHIAAAKRAIHRAAPEVVFVDSAAEAQFIVSVLMVPAHVCTHCDNGHDTEWQAIVERGGPDHRVEYLSVGPFLVLSGNVGEGASAARGFARQLAGILHRGPCGG